MIRWHRCPHEHFALIIRAILYLIFSGDGFYLILIISQISQIAKSDVIKRVTARTHFAIGLKTTLHGSFIKGAQRPVKRPFTLF